MTIGGDIGRIKKEDKNVKLDKINVFLVCITWCKLEKNKNIYVFCEACIFMLGANSTIRSFSIIFACVVWSSLFQIAAIYKPQQLWANSR